MKREQSVGPALRQSPPQWPCLVSPEQRRNLRAAQLTRTHNCVPDCFPRRRWELSKSFLVGKGVAGSPGTAPSTQAALRHAAQPTPGSSHATTHRLPLLLPHQLSVADLEKERGQETNNKKRGPTYKVELIGKDPEEGLTLQSEHDGEE
ncbi:hypothetical protein EYF80_014106 [Liparis tanakae]|uniref:Uncharacterized protein n=1 Tax=Liparis tanakae TaxID=230148 RepID=A0A4Z2IF78_9TELE|nr:hypothetical protein EYF80_014106 [Liparis tanakae]